MSLRMSDDLWDGLFKWRLWIALGSEQLRKTYRHTRLGFVWIALAFAAFCTVKIVVFSAFGERGGVHFTTWVVAGFLVWQFTSGIVSSSCSVFISSKNWITGVRLPYSIYIYRSLWVALIQFCINLMVAVIFILVFGLYMPAGFLLALLALPMLMLTAVPTYVILGMLCTYSRDLLQTIQTIMRIMFFATPIIWTPKPGTLRQTVADINPFSYYLMLFREPILTGSIPMKAVVFWATSTLALWLLAAIIYKYQRTKLVYWL